MSKFENYDGANLTGPKKATSSVHLLPAEEPNFKWRIWVDLRAALDFPLNWASSGGLPASYCELGWSLYEQTEPDEYTKILSVLVEQNRHPHWNQQLLFNNPADVIDMTGFLWITLRDRHTIEPIERFCLPLYLFKPYQPVHTEIHCWNVDFESRCKVYMSFVLEKPLQSMVDSVSRVVLNWANFRPIPSNYKKFAIMMTTDGH